MNKTVRVLVSPALAFLAVFTAATITSRAADSAREIVAEAQRRSASNSERYEGILQTFDAQEKTSEKRWTVERIGSYGQSKSVIRFIAPAEVKGVALLVVNHPDRASDQWMWIPNVERDRRIALQDRSTRFFGTDFSFEDLEERDVDQYDYELLGQENVDGAVCWKIRSIPKEKKSSQYTSLIIWIRQDNYVTARIDSYIKEQAVRRLNYTNIRNISGIWTAHEMTMNDLRRYTRTRLTMDHIEYNIAIPDTRFTLQALRTP